MATPLPPGYRFYKSMIEDAARFYALDPLLVAAVCWQESGFNTDGFRHEPGFWNRYMKHKAEFRGLNPRRVSSSYGLMQIMWPVAVEDGMSPSVPPEALFTPSIGLDAGCKRLSKLFAWAENGWPGVDPQKRLLAVLASYNGGKGGNAPDGDLRPDNAAYARSVLRHYETLKHA